MADRAAMLRLFKNVSMNQRKMVDEYKSTIDDLGDIRSPNTPFEWVAFSHWYSQLVATAPPTVDRHGDYFRKEIVFYMNRSMGFSRQQRNYFALTWNPQEEQNQWEALNAPELNLLFKHKHGK